MPIQHDSCQFNIIQVKLTRVNQSKSSQPSQSNSSKPSVNASQLNPSQPKKSIVFPAISPGFGHRVPRFCSEILRFASCFPGFVLKSFVLLPVSPNLDCWSSLLRINSMQMCSTHPSQFNPNQCKPSRSRTSPLNSSQGAPKSIQVDSSQLKSIQVSPIQFNSRNP